MKEHVRVILKERFPDAQMTLSGDDHHVVLEIQDAAFNGLTYVQQHQLIYKTLGSMVGNELHALSLKIRGTEQK